MSLSRTSSIERTWDELAPPSTELRLVLASIGEMNDRLGRLEAAFVRAVDDSAGSTDAVIAELREALDQAVGDRLSSRLSAEVVTGELVPAEAVRDLSSRVDALTDAVQLRLTAMESHVSTMVASLADLPSRVAELDEGLAKLVRIARQRDRRLANRVDDALKHQTDELLSTIDAWLPPEPETEAQPDTGATSRAPRRRVRRWLLRTLLAAIAAGSVAWSLVPFETARGGCDPAVSVLGGEGRCAEDATVRIASSGAGVILAGGGLALGAAVSRRQRRT